MNSNGLVKIAVLILGSVVSWFFLRIPEKIDHLLITSPIIPFVFSIILVPVIAKTRSREPNKVLWPNWNSGLFKTNDSKIAKPLTNLDFYAAMFLSQGVTIFTSNYIFYAYISQLSLTSISFGTGILGGVLITIFWSKKWDSQ